MPLGEAGVATAQEGDSRTADVVVTRTAAPVPAPPGHRLPLGAAAAS